MQEGGEGRGEVGGLPGGCGSQLPFRFGACATPEGFG